MKNYQCVINVSDTNQTVIHIHTLNVGSHMDHKDSPNGAFTTVFVPIVNQNAELVIDTFIKCS